MLDYFHPGVLPGRPMLPFQSVIPPCNLFLPSVCFPNPFCPAANSSVGATKLFPPPVSVTFPPLPSSQACFGSTPALIPGESGSERSKRKRRGKGEACRNSATCGKCQESTTEQEDSTGGSTIQALAAELTRFPRWVPSKPTEKPIAEEEGKSRSEAKTHSVPSVTPEMRHEALRNNPELARRADSEYVLEKEYPQLSRFLIPLLGDSESKLTMKITPALTEEEIDRLYSAFCDKVQGIMDSKISCFLEHRFNSAEEAKIALTLFVRSYVAGFTVHQRRKRSTGSCTRYELQCHTVNNRGCSKEKSNGIEATRDPVPPVLPREKCCWKAHIDEYDSFAIFTRFDSFSVHKRECFRKFSRFISEEVTLQDQFSQYCRPEVMNKLCQTVVIPNTLTQRIVRRNSAVKDEVNKFLKDKTIGQNINPSIVSHPKWLESKEDEVTDILRYLSHLKEENNVEVLVSFVEKEIRNKKNVIIRKPGDVSSLNLLYEDGKSLLSTHGEAIFCDSLWNVSENGYFGLTIVVVDENYKLRLGAISICYAEGEESWKDFFSWVKSKVPGFNPRCIATDGAPYIYNAFKAVMSNEAQHILCWWHQREIAKQKWGTNKKLRLLMLRMAYASTEEEILCLKKIGVCYSRHDDKEGDV